jgi:hypothetical protein
VLHDFAHGLVLRQHDNSKRSSLNLHATGLDWRTVICHFTAMKALTLDEAQRSLASLAQRALRGEPVLIQVEGSPQLLSLRSVDVELPEGYLADCYGPEELAEEAYLAGFAPRGTAT